MLKILAWVVSNDSRFFNGALNILERQHNGVEVVGVTASVPIHLVKDGKKVNFIPLAEVDGGGDYDLILVVGGKNTGANDIIRYARHLNLNIDKIIFDWIVCIPGFTLEKYRRLQRSRLSIFSINCFGGHMSHTLGLPFRSPLVNSFFKEKDYLRFLRAPYLYLEEDLIFKEMNIDPNTKTDYPVFTLGNIDVHFNHYDKMDEAKFNERKKKINRYNLFVEMYTEDKKILEQFDALPYGKKVCFVPFKSDLDSAWYVNPNFIKGKAFWEIVHDYSRGIYFYYDPFDMLLYGKKTQLIDM